MDHVEEFFFLFLHVDVVSLHEFIFVLVKDLLHTLVQIFKLLLNLALMSEDLLDVLGDVARSKSVLNDELV